VKGKKLADVKRELLRLLPLEVQPAVTVSQIMSRGVKTLNPDATVRDTADAMERYGHEGFPVIDSDSSIPYFQKVWSTQ
ncbi:MAG: CBS domain-containing protein, partial [Saprospiraceae bacterium]|nr:CBS domain-containing protein [Saprospiraceae bacterium]